MFAQLCEPCQSRRNAGKTFDERYTIAIPLLKLVSDAAPCGNHAQVTCAILEVGIQFCLAYYRGSKGLGRNWYHYHSSSFVTLLLFEQVMASSATDPTHMSFKCAMSAHMTIYLNTHTHIQYNISSIHTYKCASVCYKYFRICYTLTRITHYVDFLHIKL